MDAAKFNFPYEALGTDVARGGNATNPGAGPWAANELGRVVDTSGQAPTAVQYANPRHGIWAADERRDVGSAGATAIPGGAPLGDNAHRVPAANPGHGLGPPMRGGLPVALALRDTPGKRLGPISRTGTLRQPWGTAMGRR